MTQFHLCTPERCCGHRSFNYGGPEEVCNLSFIGFVLFSLCMEAVSPACAPPRAQQELLSLSNLLDLAQHKGGTRPPPSEGKSLETEPT